MVLLFKDLVSHLLVVEFLQQLAACVLPDETESRRRGLRLLRARAGFCQRGQALLRLAR